MPFYKSFSTIFEFANDGFYVSGHIKQMLPIFKRIIRATFGRSILQLLDSTTTIEYAVQASKTKELVLPHW